MKIFSKRFNQELEFDDAMVLSMPFGLPGFPDSKRFCILDLQEEDSPFKWLHDVDNTSIALLITDPFSFFSDYQPQLSEEMVQELGIKNMEDDLMIFTIVMVAEGGSQAFTNLRAPVLVNAQTRMARQVILEDDRYEIKTTLFSIAEGMQAANL